MPRRVLVGGLLVLGLAACGGSSPTASPVPSTPAPTVAPAVTPAPESTGAPSEPAAATTAKARCDAVSLRLTPATSGALVGRAYVGMKVRIVEEVTGEAYTAGTCGTSGDTWYRIDKVGGKTTQSLYNVPFVFSAAGFYE